MAGLFVVVVVGLRGGRRHLPRRLSCRRRRRRRRGCFRCVGKGGAGNRELGLGMRGEGPRGLASLPAGSEARARAAERAGGGAGRERQRGRRRRGLSLSPLSLSPPSPGRENAGPHATFRTRRQPRYMRSGPRRSAPLTLCWTRATARPALAARRGGLRSLSSLSLSLSSLSLSSFSFFVCVRLSLSRLKNRGQGAWSAIEIAIACGAEWIRVVGRVGGGGARLGEGGGGAAGGAGGRPLGRRRCAAGGAKERGSARSRAFPKNNQARFTMQHIRRSTRRRTTVA
jgi:hypothetical protein